jgi:uncharacterized membrane protein
MVYVEIVLLHTICAWCTVFHVVILIIFLMTLVQLQQSRIEEQEDVGAGDEKPDLTTIHSHT